MKKKKILIVEDDKAIAEILEELLLIEGYETLNASNGLQALQLLSKSNLLPDLILLDLMMPVMDGFEFREEQMRNSSLADIPIIIMSADGHIDEKRLKAKANDYLKKPVDIDVLLNTVKKNIET